MIINYRNSAKIPNSNSFSDYIVLDFGSRFVKQFSYGHNSSTDELCRPTSYENYWSFVKVFIDASIKLTNLD